MSKHANADLSDKIKTQMQMLEAGALTQCGCRSYNVKCNGEWTFGFAVLTPIFHNSFIASDIY